MLKKLPYLLFWVACHSAVAQTIPIRNASLDYVVNNIFGAEPLKDDIREMSRDKKGRYWFKSATTVYSFDGVNWRTHVLRGTGIPFRINNMEVTEDGYTWLTTSEGLYVYDANSEDFVPAGNLFPGLQSMNFATTNTNTGLPGYLVISSIQRPGIFLVNLTDKTVRHVVIDSDNKVFVNSPGFPITNDKRATIWGTTKDFRGIWQYNVETNVLRCSWKAELPLFAHARFNQPLSLSYDPLQQSLWISHTEAQYLEKLNVETGKSSFYSFRQDLSVSRDTGLHNRMQVGFVRIDRYQQAWLKLEPHYLVKINSDPDQWEYISGDPELLPLGEWTLFNTENDIDPAKNQGNDILFWVKAPDRFSLVKKRPGFVRHIPFENMSAGRVRPNDYDNSNGRQTVYFQNGKKGDCLMFFKNAGRAKLLCFDSSLHLKKALFNDQWKNLPAYFSTDFNTDSFFIAFMRPGEEPLDFRNVVIREFRVDLSTLTKEEVNLDFPHRVLYYGKKDSAGLSWLFSNGFLYSYHPRTGKLDSLFICEPKKKGSFLLELVKGYDYQTVLHPESNTYWINFIPAKELYKINLRLPRIEKVFRTCSNDTTCAVPASIFDMYNFDNRHVYLQASFSGLLINAFTNKITNYIDLFPHQLNFQQQVGSGLYRDWMIVVLPEDIYFLNVRSRKHKRMSRNEDFKWILSQFNSRPLVNSRNEMVLVSSAHKGFIVFPIDSVLQAARPGNVSYSFVKLDNRSLQVDSLVRSGALRLHYNSYHTIQLGFTDHSVFDPEKTEFEYALNRGDDTTWHRIEGKPELTLGELSPGNYYLLVRAVNAVGDHSLQPASLSIRIIPPFWQRLAFIVGLGLLVLAGIFYYIRNRLNAIRKKESEKTRSVRQLAELELQSLRSQLNPHFMFNSLNAIQELILMEENEKAHTYLARFSKLLRMMLENTEKPFVALNKELGFLELYLSLENLRVPDLRFSIRVDPDVDPTSTYIPNMVLQPYIENALWHGLAHKKGERILDLNIYKQNGLVIYDISDNGVGRKKAAELKSLYRKEHKSKGMELLTKRFKLLSEEFGSEIKSTVRDLQNNGEVTGTLVQLSIPADLGSAVAHGELSLLHVPGEHKNNLATARDLSTRQK